MVLINAYLMSTSGSLIYLIAPILVGTAMDSLAFDSEQAGLLLAAYFLGYTLITTSAVFWLNRVNMRSAVWLSSLVFIAALLMSATQSSAALIYGGLFFAGVGAGMLYGISITIIGQSDAPDKHFGIALAAQLVLGSGLLFAGPAIIGPLFGFAGILIACAFFVAILSLTTQWTPTSISAENQQGGDKTSRGHGAIVFVSLIALLCWFTGYSGVYAFVERIGVTSGLTGQQIGLILSLTIITGVAGAMGAAWLGNRWGHIRPHWLGMAGTVVTIGLLSNEPGLIQYSLAIIALTLSLNFWLAYMLGSITRVDISGRYAVLTTAALGGGAMVGPAISGFVLQQRDMLQVLLVSLILIFAGFSGITMALRRFSAVPVNSH
jgi:predicted MFS family arabinose efflux permease